MIAPLLLLVALGAPMTQASASPAVSDVLVSYTDQVTEFHGVSLSVSRQGDVYAHVTYAMPGMPLRSLGWYHAALGAADADVVAVGRALPAVKAAVQARPPRPPPMGGRGRTAWIAEAGALVPLSLDHDAAVTPSEQAFQDAVERLLERLGHAPLAALSMTAALDAQQASRGDALRLTLTFTNRGTAPLRFPNPALAGKPPWQALRVHVWKPAVDDDGEPSSDHETTVDLAGRELLVAERRTLQADPPLLTLDPGASLEVWTRFVVPKLAPQRYQVQPYFITARPGDESPSAHDPRIYGELHAEPVDLVVTRRGKGR